MGTSASYWVASHLTGLFAIKDGNDEILSRGSIGAGVCINRGTVTTVTRTDHASLEVYFNGVKTPLSIATVTKRVLDLLFERDSQQGIRIEHRFGIPISSGFGASAAGALGTAFAANDAFDLGFSRIRLFQIAHLAEIYSNTGLGDIIGLYQGGAEVRIKQGAPGVGQTIAMTNRDSWKIATIHIGHLATPKILSDHRKRRAINLAGEQLIEKLISEPDFGNFVGLASQFSRKLNLWSKALIGISELVPPEVVTAQIMLGDALFLFYKPGTDLETLSNLDSSFKKETICQQTVVRRESDAN
ncbi:MAG: pantoate kinase [Candidatus Heimdallarchaeota archaeon]